MSNLNPKTIPAKLKQFPKNLVEGLDIFSSLSPTALSEIVPYLIEKKYAKNETLFLEEDPAEYVWFVKSGHVKAIHHSASGRCQILCMTGPQGMFGSCCSFAQTQYLCESVAETDVTVLRIPMAPFMNFLFKHPEMGARLIHILSNRLRQSKDLQTFEYESVETRILRNLIYLVGEFGKTIPLTRREIAEMTGTTVETCIRTFLKLEAEGLVSTSRGKIIIKDVQLLSHRLESA